MEYGNDTMAIYQFSDSRVLHSLCVKGTDSHLYSYFLRSSFKVTLLELVSGYSYDVLAKELRTPYSNRQKMPPPFSHGYFRPDY